MKKLLNLFFLCSSFVIFTQDNKIFVPKSELDELKFMLTSIRQYIDQRIKTELEVQKTLIECSPKPLENICISYKQFEKINNNLYNSLTIQNNNFILITDHHRNSLEKLSMLIYKAEQKVIDIRYPLFSSSPHKLIKSATFHGCNKPPQGRLHRCNTCNNLNNLD